MQNINKLAVKLGHFLLIPYKYFYINTFRDLTYYKYLLKDYIVQANFGFKAYDSQFFFPFFVFLYKISVLLMELLLHKIQTFKRNYY